MCICVYTYVYIYIYIHTYAYIYIYVSDGLDVTQHAPAGARTCMNVEKVGRAISLK